MIRLYPESAYTYCCRVSIYYSYLKGNKNELDLLCHFELKNTASDELKIRIIKTPQYFVRQ